MRNIAYALEKKSVNILLKKKEYLISRDTFMFLEREPQSKDVHFLSYI